MIAFLISLAVCTLIVILVMIQQGLEAHSRRLSRLEKRLNALAGDSREDQKP